MKKLLILTDGKAGHENQSKAFARSLGCEFELREVHFRSAFHKSLSYLLDRLGIGCCRLFEPRLDELGEGGWCGVIGTGSGTFYAAKTLARRLGVKSGVVLYPRGYRIGGFDCVLAPVFDRPDQARNVIEIPANLVASDDDFYRRGVEAFREQGGNVCATNAVAVIIGGPNKCSTMTPEWMRSRLDEIFAANRGSEFWVTTSRRTPAEVERLVDEYAWNYRVIYSRNHFNPIPAFVKLAKRIYVTAESTGMLSEACTFGTAEVCALDNLLPGTHKFRRFVEGLREAGYLDGNRKIDLSAQFAQAKGLMGV